MDQAADSFVLSLDDGILLADFDCNCERAPAAVSCLWEQTMALVVQLSTNDASVVDGRDQLYTWRTGSHVGRSGPPHVESDRWLHVCSC